MDRPVFSDMLSSRRRELGFSIRQASRVLRLREDVLIAFEEGDFEQIPKSGYAQGMLSSYARYLGMDATQVIEAFTRDLDRYNREMRRRRREGADRSPSGISGGSTNRYGERVGQPYVRSRGLLPTSGGPAGDLGSFSTTRVRPRGYVDDTATGIDDSVYHRGADNGYGYDGAYPQGRPYTARTPRITQRSWDAGGSRRSGDIHTLGADQFDYDDDLRLGNAARSYESASTGAGRRSSRNISSSERPRVRRRGESGRARTSSRGSRDRGRGRGRSRRNAQPATNTPVVLIAIIAVVILLSVVIVLSVTTCVRQGSEARTVPVSAAMEQEQAQEQASQGDVPATTGDATKTSQDPVAGSAATGDATQQSGAAKGADTSVSVSVADGAVTWLEVECDGKSDVAETVNGPWQRTYTVIDAITIQAGDTTAVSVVQNGRQVQFESMSSGLGTMRIQGSGKRTSATKADASGKTGAKGSSEEGAEGDVAETTSSSGAGTAKMGNSSPQQSTTETEEPADQAGEQEGELEAEKDESL